MGCSLATLRLSLEALEFAGRCVEARAKELREATGSAVKVTLASYVRWLVEQGGEALGLVDSAAKREE